MNDREALESRVLKAVYESGLHQYIPSVITEKHKDGIAIDVPSGHLIRFVQKLLE